MSHGPDFFFHELVEPYLDIYKGQITRLVVITLVSSKACYRIPHRTTLSTCYHVGDKTDKERLTDVTMLCIAVIAL
jgi:predicted ABC-type sugar transport system permease subunit